MGQTLASGSLYTSSSAVTSSASASLRILGTFTTSPPTRELLALQQLQQLQALRADADTPAEASSAAPKVVS
jgi:hypothetical protein